MKKALVLFTSLITILMAGCGATNAVPPTPVDGIRVIDPPQQVPDFTLLDQTNTPITLTQLRDKVLVFTFGYTHCPDVCPINLAEFKLVKKELGDDANKVTFVFLSVDGKRDTPEVLAKYVSLFDPTFVGLSGGDGAVRAITQKFGVRYELATPEPGKQDYTVTHSASSYLVDRDGFIRRIYSYQTAPEVIAADMKTLLK